MNKLINLSIILFLLLSSIPAICAQSLTASQVLAHTTQRINSAKALEALFTATSNDGEKTEGTLTICREKFTMATKQYSVWYNGDAMWSYYTRNGEVSLTEPIDEELLEINPFDIINQYETRYKVTTKSHQNGKYLVNFIPTTNNPAFKNATVEIDEKTWLPKEINATFTNGSTIKIDIVSLTELPQAPAASFFEFPYSKYPNLPVIDLR